MFPFNRARAIAAAALITCVASACEPAPYAKDAEPYEACRDYLVGDEPSICSGGETECLITPEFTTAGFCTTRCSEDSDCPDFRTVSGVCDRFARGGQLCVLPCEPDADDDACPAGTACMELDHVGTDGEVAYCLP